MTNSGVIKCLGKTFANEEKRREYFRDELRKRLPELKKIEGFPIGEDEDIIALSDPPYYTACPNPWLNDFIAEWEAEKANTAGRKADFQVDEPYASDVSEGKNNPIYNAHSYHTKVPHPAIMRYILHYTQPGDIIFDGFAGTGMTGVAAQMCGRPDSQLQFRIETEFKSLGLATPVWGARKAICGDLSPIASFIAYNYNTPVDVYELEKEAKRILHEVEEECGWMYETRHIKTPSPSSPPVKGGEYLIPSSARGEGATFPLFLTGDNATSTLSPLREEGYKLVTPNLTVGDSKHVPSPLTGEGQGGGVVGLKGRINYTVWSDVFICPACGGEIIFWDAAVDKEAGKVKDEFHCTHCNAIQTKRSVTKAKRTLFDKYVEQDVEQASSLQEDVEQASCLQKDNASSLQKNECRQDAYSTNAGRMPALLAFFEEHLKHLPVHIAREQKTTAIIERSPKILYDRLISLYIMRGLRVPIDAADFQDMLMRSFIERDGMYFLPEQAAEYDKKKALMPQMEQMALIVTTEAEGLLWLKAKLTDKMITYQEIQPQWMQAITAVRKGEILPELKVLLEESFLQEPDGRWRLPDMNEAKDREALRTKALLKEFDKYVEQASSLQGAKAGKMPLAKAGRMPAPLPSSLHKSIKKLKEVRIEALHAGFKSCWEKKDFQTIITIGDKIPQNLLLEDEQLLMFYDIAKDRT